MKFALETLSITTASGLEVELKLKHRVVDGEWPIEPRWLVTETCISDGYWVHRDHEYEWSELPIHELLNVLEQLNDHDPEVIDIYDE